MSIPQKPKSAKLVIGCFTGKINLIERLAPELVKNFGAVDMISSWLPFNYTSYYRPEMGEPLFRRVFVFNALVES